MYLKDPFGSFFKEIPKFYHNYLISLEVYTCIIEFTPYHFILTDVHELHVRGWGWICGTGAVWDGLCHAVALPDGGPVLLAVRRAVYRTWYHVQCQVKWAVPIYVKILVSQLKIIIFWHVHKNCIYSYLKPLLRTLDNFYNGPCVLSATLKYSKILVQF